MIIRPFHDDDYAIVTHLHNVNYPDYTKGVDEIRLRDSLYPASSKWARWVAEADHQVIGFAEYHQKVYSFHPRKFSLELAVDPDFYGRGIGRRMYDRLMEALAPLDPLSVDTWSREDMAFLVRFLERRGFATDMCMLTVELDLQAFTPEKWLDRVERVEAQGIQMRSLAELGAADPAVRAAVYKLWLAVRDDVPGPPGEIPAEVTYDQFWERMDTPYFLARGYFLAIDDGQCVGTSQLFLSSRDGELRTGLTAVRGEYRRRGIALALKVRALRLGKTLGYRRVITENASTNQGMLAINHDLGFVANPAWLHYVKTLSA